MIKLLLIGHRGAGKSGLIKKAQDCLAEQVAILSLDQWIEEKQQTDIKTIFKEKGEVYFRKIEREGLEQIVQQYKLSPIIVDVGAGFEGAKPEGWQALWVRRSVDLSRFQFLDRPALDQGLRISAVRFQQREQRYQDFCDFQIEIREGAFDDGLEQDFFQAFHGKEKQGLKHPWWVTVLDRKHAALVSYLKNLGPVRYELRDDLLGSSCIEELLVKYPESLVSFRDQKKLKQTMALLKPETLWDWPLEWGPNDQASILSLHRRQKDFSQTLKDLPQTNQVIKLAVAVESFTELKQGYLWQREDPQNRVFLPCSGNGRWSWFRLLTADKSPLCFLREGQGSSLDQPSLFEALSFQSHYKDIAAILGSPVKHSLTPAFHQEYFRSLNANVLRIDLGAYEFEMAVPWLIELGLKYAAVTSPLKTKAAEMAGHDLSSVNTLFVGDSIEGTNTDMDGFRALFKGVDACKVAVWGGGGTLPAIEKCLPEAAFYSSRTGELKKGQGQEQPEVLIWAVGSEAFLAQGQFPPASWAPKMVLDLNYRFDSPGIACAFNYGCQYRSGLVMFVEQARKQQEFWDERRLK